MLVRCRLIAIQVDWRFPKQPVSAIWMPLRPDERKSPLSIACDMRLWPSCFESQNTPIAISTRDPVKDYDIYADGIADEAVL